MYSEIDPLIRASRTNYSELEADLGTMTEQCNNASNYVKVSGKFGTDTEHIVETFLQDASLRIEGLKKIENKILKRFSKFLSWLGIPSHFESEYPPHVVAKIVADLALQFKINLDQIRESEERRENIKTKKVQRRSAPNLRYSAKNSGNSKVNHRSSIGSNLGETDLEEFLATAAREEGRRAQ